MARGPSIFLICFLIFVATAPGAAAAPDDQVYTDSGHLFVRTPQPLWLATGEEDHVVGFSGSTPIGDLGHRRIYELDIVSDSENRVSVELEYTVQKRLTGTPCVKDVDLDFFVCNEHGVVLRAQHLCDEGTAIITFTDSLPPGNYAMEVRANWSVAVNYWLERTIDYRDA